MINAENFYDKSSSITTCEYDLGSRDQKCNSFMIHVKEGAVPSDSCTLQRVILHHPLLSK